jgi:predicted transglutaminase-like cysteine proteinase
MSRLWWSALAVVAAVAGVVAGTPSPTAQAREGAAWRRIDDLATGRAVPGPAGWLNYCMAAGLGRCGGSAPPAEVAASPEALALVKRAQAEVNRRVVARAEPAGRDLWQVASASGDCEDYALAKQALLRAAGLPPGAVRLATAVLPSGEHHAVLTVATTRGTLVLDNLRKGVVPLAALPYRWLRLEDPTGGLRWKELRGEAELAESRSASPRPAPSAATSGPGAATGGVAQ